MSLAVYEADPSRIKYAYNKNTTIEHLRDRARRGPKRRQDWCKAYRS